MALIWWSTIWPNCWTDQRLALLWEEQLDAASSGSWQPCGRMTRCSEEVTVKKLNALARRYRAGENANAFRGGFRLWAGTNVLPSNRRPEGGSLKSVRFGT